MTEADQLVMLDFDGVIADTFHVAHMVAKKACIYLTEQEYKKRFEGNIYTESKAYFEQDHGDQCDHDLDWWGHYTLGFNAHAKPFAGMSEVVREISKQRKIFIVSSCRNNLIDQLLEKNEIKHCIAGLYGMDVGLNKNEKFETICAEYRTDPKHCIFVTDTLGDVNEATGVGINSIGVTWGFQDRATLERGNPFAIVDTPQEIVPTIERYFVSTQ